MGASRLVDEALDRAAAVSPALLVLRGRSNGPADPPWSAVLDALAPALEATPREELQALLRRDARPILMGLPGMAALAARMPEPRSSALEDPERRQPRALEALFRWLGRLATERPVVLVLEDLHRRRCRDARLRDVRRADRPGRADGPGAHVPAGPPHPGAPAPREPLGHRGRPPAPGPRGSRPACPTRDRRPDRGHRGGAAVGVHRGPGRGAVGGLAAGGRGAGRRAPRAAQHVA